ncbi:2-dehydro-3-deoxygalactonokinase [Pantoea sp. BAV 3049]|uniref:2-dehydro-3-deoxygalactonokinase n=1 Tax=Pantoea sp. BAV 3049 TaxID=2654188 RepID=UPI00131A6647|nr:2-dehydro-3-deoxygalactonokinase [Pantoea sp. BAV 3049]
MERWIAVDWGSTHLRGWLFADDQCVQQLQLPLGITQLHGQSPADIFGQYIAPWREDAPVPVVMAGMIGSDAGWRRTPYLACPTSLSDLSERLCEVADNVWIVPGLMVQRADGCDVMRGEETQLAGVIQLMPAQCYVMPGTHCKWVDVDDGQICHFSTAMTGELHHLLMDHSLTGKGLPAQQADNDAFKLGLERGMDTPSLISRLFTARADRLLGTLAVTSVADYLSGLLIGAEVSAFCRQKKSGAVTLVGSPQLNARYRQAFERINIAVTECPGDNAFLQGIRSLVYARQ